MKRLFILVLLMTTSAFAGLDAKDGKVINVADPTAEQDAATRKYVDDQIIAAGGSTQEQTQDWIWSGSSIGVTTLITLTYDDINNEIDFVVDEASIDHDALTNFVSGEHFLQSAITVLGTIITGVWNGTVIDISDYTNLAAGTNITLSGDTLNVDDAFIKLVGDTTGVMSEDLNLDDGTFVISYDDNRVGIGTTTPSRKFHVQDSVDTEITVATTDSAKWAMFGMGTDNNIRAAHILTYGTTHASQANELSIKNLWGDITIFTGTAGGTAERMRIDSSGDVGIGTVSPTAKLDVNSDILRLRTPKTPANATASGNQGDISWDSNYIYVCVATNNWRRSALVAWGVDNVIFAGENVIFAGEQVVYP